MQDVNCIYPKLEKQYQYKAWEELSALQIKKEA